MAELYIGLMSGTSIDGVDAALIDFSHPLKILATHYTPYPDELKTKILKLSTAGENEIMRLGELDVILGHYFAEVTLALLQKTGTQPSAIKAIGSHGHNIRHCPNHAHPFTLQIGDPNIIAAETGITVVADFRRRDVALGGQGAPLVPAFHQAFFASIESNRVVVNIGGIANLTYLPKNSDQLIGFDTGPGNTLLDAWIYAHQGKWQDKEGAWGSQGKLNHELLSRLLSDSYFQQSPPKSSGREYFNLAWLQTALQSLPTPIDPIDVQTTLVELTATSILSAIQQLTSEGDILVCGGGTHNQFLMTRLQQLAPCTFSLATTGTYGLDPDWVEAVAFAWMARQTCLQQPSNHPLATGAKKASILGGLYYGSEKPNTSSQLNFNFRLSHPARY